MNLWHTLKVYLGLPHHAAKGITHLCFLARNTLINADWCNVNTLLSAIVETIYPWLSAGVLTSRANPIGPCSPWFYTMWKACPQTQRGDVVGSLYCDKYRFYFEEVNHILEEESSEELEKGRLTVSPSTYVSNGFTTSTAALASYLARSSTTQTSSAIVSKADMMTR